MTANLDDYGRTPEERKVWLKESQKYWERTINRLLEKTGSLQKELLSLGGEIKKAEINMNKIILELGE